MHEPHIPLALLQDIRLPVAVAVVDERATTAGLRHASRKIAPLPDRAQAFVQKHERRACPLIRGFATDPFIGERVARRFHRWHAAILAALRASSASNSP